MPPNLILREPYAGWLTVADMALNKKRPQPQRLRPLSHGTRPAYPPRVRGRERQVM
ncbi:MAG: hypothetical protein KA314_30270 [Chloroflexi bacterium]|nr:hypothetical protein [Chloroflexota bacterium]MBP8060146.1 hypothetical protein [Chloroflexota bacterium]